MRLFIASTFSEEILRALKTLETINGKPVAEFWKAVDARKAALEAWLERVSVLPAEKQVEVSLVTSQRPL